MPLLCGDNPLTNVVPSKFLRLTDYQLFILRQWARGHFINEIDEGWLQDPPYNPFEPYPTTPPQDRPRARSRRADERARRRVLPGRRGRLDHAQSVDLLGAVSHQGRSLACRTSCETRRAGQHRPPACRCDYTFNVENPLSQDNDFDVGLQPGDMTKYMALPWQSDFNECTTNPTDVTYADWNNIYPDSEQRHAPEARPQGVDTLWWPAHRPLQYTQVVSVSQDGKPNYQWTQLEQRRAADQRGRPEDGDRMGVARLHHPQPLRHARAGAHGAVRSLRPGAATSASSVQGRLNRNGVSHERQSLRRKLDLSQPAERSPTSNTDFNNLEFGRGTIVINEAPMQLLTGTIGGPGWSLKLKGARAYGNPMSVRFQGKGIVGGEEWIYDYEGWLVPAWPNGVQQVPAMVGSIVRTIPHSGSAPKGKPPPINPAGVVASWYAVKAS